jgi:alpha-L-rhamnosidase
MHTTASSPVEAYDLRVDGRFEPLTVAGAAPELQWRMRGAASAPTLVRIHAATRPDLLDAGSPDLWDSGVVDYSGPSVSWAGHPLVSGATVFWRVGLAVADDGFVWSAPARFGVALLDASDWAGAQWVTHPAWSSAASTDGLPALETEFTAPAQLRDARLFIAASGVVSVSVNGVPASADVLAPGYARYDRRVPAVAWDITPAIVEGVNALRIELGTGVSWVAPTDRYSKLVAEHLLPRVLVKLDLDGTSVVSGESWRSTLTATSVAHWFAGEDHDARDSDHDPHPAAVLGDSTLHTVWWNEHPGLRVTETLPALDTVAHDDGVRVIDFGTNVVGWPELTVTAPAGIALQLWPAELLDPAGRADQRTTGTPLFDEYTTRDGEQTWHPRFVYHGFRYLEVRGLGPHDPDPVVIARVIRAANERAGTFETDDAYLASLDRLIDRAIQGNMFSVFTDCPNREKLGWIEQLYLCFDALARHYDVDAHLRDAIVHMSDSQLADGSVPSIAPETVDFSNHEFNGDPDAFRHDPNWGGAIAFLPWRLYENYGDVRALELAWPATRRYVAYLDSRATDGLVDFGLGDWIALDTSTPRAMVATFGYLRVLETASRIAAVLGHADDAAGYRAQADRARRAFASAFEGENDRWGSGSQGSYALALDAGVVDAGSLPAVRERLLEAIRANGSRLSTGENSWPSMFRALHEMGRDDVTARLVRDADGPGYGWQLKHGATSLTESWVGATGADKDNSQNHFMLGMVHDWMTQIVGGLAQHEHSIGWRRALIAPVPIAGVERMHVTYQSPMGQYSVTWSDGQTFRLDVVVPPGGSALVRLPRTGAQHEVTAGTWSYES